jgi:lipopolysaccharide assembly outer membrane protein LptD (OstA)
VKGPEIFNSKYVKLIEDTNKMMLIQNVVIQYGDLYVEADSALLEKPKNRVTAFGVQKASFKGISVSDPKKLAMIKYTKGDARFYTD